MVTRRNRIAIAAGALVIIGWLPLLLVWPSPGEYEYLAIGAIFGTMLGQTTLASAWVPFEPGRLIWRLPLSIAWIATMILAFMFPNYRPDPKSQRNQAGKKSRKATEPLGDRARRSPKGLPPRVLIHWLGPLWPRERLASGVQLHGPARPTSSNPGSNRQSDVRQ